MFIDHIGIAVTDYDRSRNFYRHCLAPLGMEMIVEIEGWAGFGKGDKADFWFGLDVSVNTPMHIAFKASDRAAVDRFHAAGLAAGGEDNGAPGLRQIYHPDYYAAFLIDPDGHNIEAVCHRAE